MIAVIRPHRLQGSVDVPASKSYAHRMLIAAALSDRPTDIACNALNADISATIDCLRALGAHIDLSDGSIRVGPVAKGRVEDAYLDCNESGSTLRFMLPVAAALGRPCRFDGRGRLPERPNDVLTDAMQDHGMELDRSLLPIAMRGKLRGGRYALRGDVSSQYITGLLFALPLCAEDSAIELTTPLESSAYVDMTTDTLDAFGIRVSGTEGGWRIPGLQRYMSPGSIAVEGDWSSAAFWLAANALGHRIDVRGLNADSRQGDRAISRLLRHLGGTIDLRETPDLAPILAVAASLHGGTTRFTGGARLRLKESDRLKATADLIAALGGRCDEGPDGLTVYGVEQLKGGAVQGQNDHRIVMAAAIAATRAAGEVVITDAQAVSKSYPGFFDDYRRLGGDIRVEQDR
ncbi:MAG: 3-phosphoshikimate 1-carboxyvinyltransferase [Clostridiales bacterium]|nr:3-phosphoshikimate 1-carboxyvinyltransferase [Clostridiales bacterium]